MPTESPDIPPQDAEGSEALRAVAERAHRPFADSAALVDCSGCVGRGARGFSDRQGFAIRLQQAEVVAGVERCRKEPLRPLWNC